VNSGDRPVAARISLNRFTPSKPSAIVEELTAALDATNTAENPERIKAIRKEWRHHFANGSTTFTFQPHSFTVIKLN
jgi:alpha-L-arabinofuranosidase